MTTKNSGKEGFGFSEDASEFRFFNGKTVSTDAPLSISESDRARGNEALKAFTKLGSTPNGKRQSLYNLALLGRAMLIPWAPVAFSFWLVGPTGTFKTSILALFKSAYGDQVRTWELNPLAWSAKPAGIELALSRHNGMVLGIDNYAPTSNDRRINDKAQHVIRHIGDVTDVARATWKDGNLDEAESHTPKALCISTAERLPQLEPSDYARIFVNEIKKGDYTKEEIQGFYDTGHAKNLHLEMMGSIKEVLTAAKDGRLTKDTLDAQIYKHQQSFGPQSHERTGRNAAEIITGLEWKSGPLFIEDEHRSMMNQCTEILRLQIRKVSAIESESAVLEDKAQRLLSNIRAAIENHEAYLLHMDSPLRISGLYRGMEYLGRYDEKGVYLIPESALKAAGIRYPECRTWSPTFFYQVLAFADLLVRNQKSDQRSTNKWIDGKQRRVAHLAPDVLDRLGVVPGESDASDEADERASMPDDVRLAPSDNDDMQAALEASPGALQILEVDADWTVKDFKYGDRYARLAKGDLPYEILAFIRRAD